MRRNLFRSIRFFPLAQVTCRPVAPFEDTRDGRIGPPEKLKDAIKFSRAISRIPLPCRCVGGTGSDSGKRAAAGVA
jgi:hypothetical protein